MSVNIDHHTTKESDGIKVSERTEIREYFRETERRMATTMERFLRGMKDGRST